jgi:hypothetical protein
MDNVVVIAFEMRDLGNAPDSLDQGGSFGRFHITTPFVGIEGENQFIEQDAHWKTYGVIL